MIKNTAVSCFMSGKFLKTIITNYLKCTLYCFISPMSFYNIGFLIIHNVDLCCIHCFFLNYIISFIGCFICWIWCCIWIGGFGFPIWVACKYTEQKNNYVKLWQKNWQINCSNFENMSWERDVNDWELNYFKLVF